MISERGVVVLVVLRLPHLVLADVGDDDRLALGDAPDVVDDVRGVEVAVVGQVLDVADRGVALERRRCARATRAWSPCSTRGSSSLERLAQVADEADVDA